MSAAIASRRRPSRIASAIRGSSSTSSTRTLGCYEPAHIAGVSKTAYVPATPRCLEWRRDRQPTSTNDDRSGSDSQTPGHRPGRRDRGDRGPRLPVTGVVVADGVLVADGALVVHGVVVLITCRGP